MVVESVSILAILLCIMFIFLRSGHKGAALGVVPLLLVPFSHLMGIFLSFWLVRLLTSVPRPVMIAFADIAGVLISGVLIHQFAVKLMEPGRPRKLYITLMGGYNVILTCTYVYRTLIHLAK